MLICTLQHVIIICCLAAAFREKLVVDENLAAENAMEAIMDAHYMTFL